MGVIVWDYLAEVIASLLTQLPFWVDADCVEAFTAAKTLEFAGDLGLTAVDLEGDSITIVNGFHEVSGLLSNLGHVLQFAMECRARFRCFKATYVGTQGDEEGYNRL
ncbi:unnamed protein product [Camellia sinensis]